MGKVYNSITQLVGKTPLLELVNYEKKNNIDAKILVKLEYFNPNQSVKDRIALAMIEDAEKKGLLKPGYTIVETTSGNTGIGLAAIAAAKGYKFRVYIQDNVSEERFKVIKAFGGETIKLSDEPAVAEALDATNGDFIAAIAALKEKKRKGDLTDLTVDNSRSAQLHKTSVNDRERASVLKAQIVTDVGCELNVVGLSRAYHSRVFGYLIHINVNNAVSVHNLIFLRVGLISDYIGVIGLGFNFVYNCGNAPNAQRQNDNGNGSSEGYDHSRYHLMAFAHTNELCLIGVVVIGKAASVFSVLRNGGFYELELVVVQGIDMGL